MVAVEQPRADCGHVAAVTQQCGKCLRWCCPECYAPWTALACGDCRVEARVANAAPTVIPSTTAASGQREKYKAYERDARHLARGVDRKHRVTLS